MSESDADGGDASEPSDPRTDAPVDGASASSRRSEAPEPSNRRDAYASASDDARGPASNDARGAVADGGAAAGAAQPEEPLTPAAAFSWRRNLDQFMPVILFLAFYNLFSTEAAVLAVTAWSLRAAYLRRRRGLPIGAWLPLITGYLVVRAGITIAVERDLVDFGVSSEAVYFGIGIGTKMLVGVAAAATILAGRPFVLWAARRFLSLSERVRRDRRFVVTLRNATWVIVVYEIGSALWDIWLYNSTGVNSFLIARQLVNFVTAFGLLFVTLWYVDRRFSAIEGCPTLVDIVDGLTRRTSRPLSS